jgi:hypothetical protein
MRFQCKICHREWVITTFKQVDDIQSVQCPDGQPMQNCVLRAVIE